MGGGEKAQSQVIVGFHIHLLMYHGNPNLIPLVRKSNTFSIELDPIHSSVSVLYTLLHTVPNWAQLYWIWAFGVEDEVLASGGSLLSFLLLVKTQE